MRLLFITKEFPNPWQPTLGVFNRHLASALSRRHEVRVVAPIHWTEELAGRRRGGASLPRGRVAQVGGVEVHYPRYYYTPKVLRSRYGWFYWRSARRAVRRLIDSFRPDAVLGYWIHPDGETAVRAARLATTAAGTKVPSAVIVGGSDVLVITEDPARRARVVDVLEATDAVITVNRDLASRVESFGVPRRKIHPWQQGVDEAVFFTGDRADARRRVGIEPVDGRVVVWVGRMVPVKGLDVLLEAWARGPLKEVSDARLYLVGDGPLRPALEAQAQSLGLQGRVVFAGAKQQAQLGDWYRAADLTVLPSRSEGLPNVLRESLACGTPFVASNVGGIREVAGDRWLVPPEDPAALSEMLARALRDPSAVAASAGGDFRIADWSESAEALVGILDAARSRDSATAAPATTGAAPLSAVPGGEGRGEAAVLSER